MPLNVVFMSLSRAGSGSRPPRRPPTRPDTTAFNLISNNVFAFNDELGAVRVDRDVDFSLRPDSPALRLGFRPFDLSAAGARLDND